MNYQNNLQNEKYENYKKNMINILIISIIFIMFSSINLGLIGVFNFDLLSYINKFTFDSNYFNRVVYSLTGLSALYLLYIVYYGKN
jgi:uncharacterized membrane protein YuzA (DUF378 family)